MKKEASRQTESVIFEGMTSINAVLRSVNGRRIRQIYFDKEKITSRSRELSFLKKASAENGFEIVFCDTGSINEKAIGTSHGGIIAECTAVEVPKLDTLVPQENGFYVMIDGIEDPYNFGYALRTVYAAGADGVILSERNWMSAAGVVCRSSAGASELLPSFTANDAEACDFFKNAGYKIVCAGIRDSVSVFDADMKKPVFLIVGGEKRGISSAVAEKADITVRIDYGREFRGSLSAASAASILAYEVFRQNR